MKEKSQLISFVLASCLLLSAGIPDNLYGSRAAGKKNPTIENESEDSEDYENILL